MIDIEERINKKIRTTQEKRAEFEHKGAVEEKKAESIVKILNLDDFKQDIHPILFDVVKKTFMRSKEIFTKELCCYNDSGAIVVEGVMDTEESNYFINNIIFRITDIELVRIQAESIKVDEKEIYLAGETMFTTAFEDKLQGFVYKTGDDYIADVSEAREKQKKLLERNIFNKILDKDKKIRYSQELNKIYIR